MGAVFGGHAILKIPIFVESLMTKTVFKKSADRPLRVRPKNMSPSTRVTGKPTKKVGSPNVLSGAAIKLRNGGCSAWLGAARIELPHLALRPCTAEVFIEQWCKFSTKIDAIKTVSGGNPNAVDDGLHVVSETQRSVNVCPNYLGSYESKRRGKDVEVRVLS
jgi:hypothetical protein